MGRDRFLKKLEEVGAHSNKKVLLWKADIEKNALQTCQSSSTALVEICDDEIFSELIKAETLVNTSETATPKSFQQQPSSDMVMETCSPSADIVESTPHCDHDVTDTDMKLSAAQLPVPREEEPAIHPKFMSYQIIGDNI